MRGGISFPPAVRYALPAATLVLVALLLFSNAIAETAWRDYRVPHAAFYLPHRNGALTLEIGNYYFGVGEYDLENAEQAYRKALSIDRKILWGHYQLARVHFMQGRHDAALLEVNRELEANPENLRSLYVRGLIQANRGDLAAAEEDFRRFTLWASKEWAGYNDLAWVLSKRGEHAEAKAAIKKAFTEVPDAGANPWLWNALGVTELNLGNRGAARKAFGMAEALAAKLTEAEWRAAYPGNDPGDALSGVAAFQAAIAENLRRSR